MTRRLVIGVDPDRAEAAAARLSRFPGLEPAAPEASVDNKWREKEHRLENLKKRLDWTLEALSLGVEEPGPGRRENMNADELEQSEDRLDRLRRRLERWQEETERIEGEAGRLRKTIERLAPLDEAGFDLPVLPEDSFMDLRCGWLDDGLMRRTSFPALRAQLAVLALAGRDGRSLVAAVAKKGYAFVLDRMLETLRFSSLFTEQMGKPPQAALDESRRELGRLERRRRQIEKLRQETARENGKELAAMKERIEESLTSAAFVRRYAARGERRLYFVVSIDDNRVEALLRFLEESVGEIRAAGVRA